MDQEHTAVPPPAAHEWPVGLIVGFSAVFVVGFALIAAVLVSRRKQNFAAASRDSDR